MVACSLLITIVVACVAHEMGHLVAAHLAGVPVRLLAIGVGPTLWRRQCGEISLVVRAFPVGISVGVQGRRAPNGSARRRPETDMIVAVAGPLASLLLAVIAGCLVVMVPAPGLHGALLTLALLSAVLGALNLLPFPGLDGGHLAVLTLALCGWQLSPQGEAKLHKVGLRVAAGLCLAAWGARLSGMWA